MDRREHMLDAIGEVGSDLVFEAETKRFAPSALRRWGGVAAALALALGLTVLALPWIQTGDSGKEAAATTDAAATDTAEVPEPTEEVPAEATDPAAETEEVADAPTTPDLSADSETAGPEQYASWTLSLPGYEDAKDLWESGRGSQLLTNFVTTLETGCPNPWDDLLNFSNGRELDDLDLIRFFRLMLNQQKGNGWYSGPSYEDRWFQAQTDLEPDSPYSALGGWYDVPVSEIRSQLSYWLTDYDLDPAALTSVMVEEDTVRFDTLTPLDLELPLVLEEALFDDDTQTMVLCVARYTDATLNTVEVRRIYCLVFEGGLVRYQSILTA